MQVIQHWKRREKSSRISSLLNFLSCFIFILLSSHVTSSFSIFILSFVCSLLDLALFLFGSTHFLLLNFSPLPSLSFTAFFLIVTSIFTYIFFLLYVYSYFSHITNPSCSSSTFTGYVTNEAHGYIYLVYFFLKSYKDNLESVTSILHMLTFNLH
jgi:hypothetical protein